MVAIDGFAFLGAQHLLTVGRPEGLAAYLADLLTEGVLSLFGKAFLLFFCLLMGFCAVSIAKPLPCAVRIKLLTALFADTLRVLMPVIRRPAFRLCFGLMCNIALTLPVLLALGFFRRFLLGFLSCFGNFLFGKWVKLAPPSLWLYIAPVELHFADTQHQKSRCDDHAAHHCRRIDRHAITAPTTLIAISIQSRVRRFLSIPADIWLHAFPCSRTLLSQIFENVTSMTNTP